MLFATKRILSSRDHCPVKAECSRSDLQLNDRRRRKLLLVNLLGDRPLYFLKRNWQPWNGYLGSTITRCSNPSGTYRWPKLKLTANCNSPVKPKPCRSD
jgi:hypothetical protein